MKKYISPGAWFSLEYPDNWCEFEDSEDCFLFYNPDKWTGNFRISAYRGNSSAYANECLEDELHQVRMSGRRAASGTRGQEGESRFMGLRLFFRKLSGEWRVVHHSHLGNRSGRDFRRVLVHRSQRREPQGWRSYCSFPEGAQCIRQAGEGSDSGPYPGNQPDKREL